MEYTKRAITKFIQDYIDSGMSILLLGPRQTGKTTLIKEAINSSATFSFAALPDHMRYESSPDLFVNELNEIIESSDKKPLIFIDEIQKIPRFMDHIQYCIDEGRAQFILSGSSARKLKHGPSINLLPGRVIMMRLSPFLYDEIKSKKTPLEELIHFGSLPIVHNTDKRQEKEAKLHSYVHGYLQDEIRAEGLVKNLASFSKFLQLAAGESGKHINFSKLSSDIGVADTTIQTYYQILDDCMIAHRIDPITKSISKRRLIRSPRYLFFDLGVRRVAAAEGRATNPRQLGELFEQFVGLELINIIHSGPYFYKLNYWRDSAGPEVDYVLDTRDEKIPIEVKYKNMPTVQDAKHLFKFIEEYQAKKGYVVCTTPKRFIIHKDPTIIALPWQELYPWIQKIHSKQDW